MGSERYGFRQIQHSGDCAEVLFFKPGACFIEIVFQKCVCMRMCVCACVYFCTHMSKPLCGKAATIQEIKAK